MSKFHKIKDSLKKNNYLNQKIILLKKTTKKIL